MLFYSKRVRVSQIAAIAIIALSVVKAQADPQNSQPVIPTVPAGISIPVRISKDPSDNGVAVSYLITEDVKDTSNNVLIPKGSTGSGRIIQQVGSVGFGGPGKTEVSLDNVVTPDGKTMSVTSKVTHYGRDTRFASIFFLGLWGYFTKGGSGKVGSSNNLVFVTE